MRYSERLYYYLSREFKNSEAIKLLNAKINKFPYDWIKYVKFGDEDYKYINQGTKIDYRVDPENPRDITVIVDTYDGLKNKKIILEIRSYGNEVNIITKAYREDTNVFHIKHYKSNTVNMLNKTVKFMDTDKEETVNFSFAKFRDDGDLLDYKDSNIIDSDNNYIKKIFIFSFFLFK